MEKQRAKTVFPSPGNPGPHNCLLFYTVIIFNCRIIAYSVVLVSAVQHAVF